MASTRRRVLRPSPPQTLVDPHRLRMLERRREKLKKERASLERWKTRLRRAFRAVEKQQAKVVRLERQIRSSE